MYKILIVEDDPMVAMINEQYIKKNKNFELVGKCSNGAAALEFLENNEVDLLVLDVYMPQMDGCKIYLKVNNVWVEADSTEFGSYLVFEGEGEEIEIAVVRQTLRILPFAVIGGIVIVGLAILIVLGVKKAKQKKAFAKESEKPIETK